MSNKKKKPKRFHLMKLKRTHRLTFDGHEKLFKYPFFSLSSVYNIIISAAYIAHIHADTEKEID